MKILITTDTYKPAVNGVVTSVINLYEQLTYRGHEVRILTLSQTSESRKEGAVYYIGSFALNLYPDIRGSLRLRHPYLKELIGWEPDIIHTQCEFATYLFARRIAAKLSIPMIHTYHTLYEDYTHYFIKSKKIGKMCVAVFSRTILRKANAVIVPTGKVYQVLKGYGIPDKMFEVPTGIQLEHFQSPNLDCIHTLRAEWGIREQDFVLIYVGRLGQEKQVEQLLSYMKEVVKRDSAVKLLLVGDGPQRSQLEKLAETYGIQEHVVFTGMVGADQVPLYYHMGDVFVNASNSETQGLTYLEALACSLPVICKDDPCIESLICSGDNGYTFTNEKEFLKAVLWLANHTTDRNLMAKRALDSVKPYSAQIFGSQMEWIYTQEIQKGEIQYEHNQYAVQSGYGKRTGRFIGTR